MITLKQCYRFWACGRKVPDVWKSRPMTEKEYNDRKYCSKDCMMKARKERRPKARKARPTVDNDAINQFLYGGNNA